jgi:hypothetical protein
MPKNSEKDRDVEESKNFLFRTEKVRVLDRPSVNEIRSFVRGRLGGLVFRKIERVMLDGKGTQKYFYHSPNSCEEISEADYKQLPASERKERTEIRYDGSYTLATQSTCAFPAHDVFARNVIFAYSSGFSDISPKDLVLVPKNSKESPLPTEANGKAHEEDPKSLICGKVQYNPRNGKYEFVNWFIASSQFMRAVMCMLYPEADIPIKQNEYRKDPAAQRAWLFGGNRLRTNTFRSQVYPLKQEEILLSEEETDAVYTRFFGEEAGLHNCHIWAMWVLMVKYGELPSGKSNVPTLVPPPTPRDPKKAQRVWKPMNNWDLPYWGPTKKSRKRLDMLIVEDRKLKFTEQERSIPYNKRSVLPEKTLEPLVMEEEPGQNDVGVLVPSRPATPLLDTESDIETLGSESSEPRSHTPTDLSQSVDTGLSSDSDSETSVRSQSPVFVTPTPILGWGDRTEEEMDFDLPPFHDSQ